MYKDIESIYNTDNRQSDRYNIIKSSEVIETLQNAGWIVTQASERQVRRPDFQGKQYHIVKFERPDLMVGDDPINLVFSNSHDGKHAAKFMLGIYRMVCSNGLIAGDNLVPSISIPHNQPLIDNAIEVALDYILQKVTSLDNGVVKMKKLTLTKEIKEQFAEEALKIKGFEKVNKIQIKTLLDPNRPEDSDDSLWTIYNTVQESIEKGLFLIDENRKARPINSTKVKVQFNTKLFDLAHGLAA